tara:strand:+ start:747 stop:1388 length:642 start_codon:yes stop_codon:yes gene_type:complete
MGLFDIFKSIFRGGAIKNLAKKAVKGVKNLFTGGGSKVVKGIKRGGTKVVRGIKKTKAQVKEIPKAVGKAKQLAKSGALASQSAKDKTKILGTFINNQLKKAGKTALTKDASERLAKKLSKNLVPVLRKQAKDKSFKKILANARKNETWTRWLGRNASKLSREGRQVASNLAREAGENLAVDQTLSMGAKLGIGLGSSAVGSAVTAGVVSGTN